MIVGEPRKLKLEKYARHLIASFIKPAMQVLISTASQYDRFFGPVKQIRAEIQTPFGGRLGR